RISSCGNDAIFGDDAVLFSAGDDFTCQQDQRMFGIVYQNELIHLSARAVVRHIVTLPSHQWAHANVSCFRNNHVAGTDAIIKSDEIAGIVRVLSYDGKYGEPTL